MYRTRVKICGITSIDDALLAARLGADAIGLVFYPPSPRHVSLEQAAAISAALPAFVTRVGLFVDAAPELIEQAVATAQLDLLQFHGDESPQTCRQVSRPVMKALRMRPELDPAAEIARYAGVQAVLLDAYRKGVPGGTGETFDWARVPASCERPLVLAGGLDADNVRNAIIQVRPWAVDVSGGVEREPGRKCPDRLRAFMQAVSQGDQKLREAK